MWVKRLPFCLDPIVTWVYRVRLTEDGRNLMALFCLFLFGGAECLPCLFSHSYFFHLFVRRGNRRIRLGTSPACAWRIRIVGKKLFLSTWFFATVLTTKLKNAQFCTSQKCEINLFYIYFAYIIQNWFLSPSGDLGISLVWHNLSGPDPTATFRSDFWNPFQSELNYLWRVFSCSQDDIRWFSD